MYYLLFAIHLLISFLIVVVVLLQRSKGGGLSGAFGGVGAGDAVFGGVGVTTFLHKATIYLAIGFMVTSLGLAYLTAMRSEVVSPGPAGAGAGQVVLPVSSDPTMPEGTAGSFADSVIVDDAIVPQGTGEIVPTPADTNATETTEGGGEGGQDQ